MNIVIYTMAVEKPMKIELEGYGIEEKKVKPGGNSGRVYVPKEWINCKVKVIRIEPITNKRQ